MNDEMKLRLAYAETVRLKDEVASANRGHADLVAHDDAMRTDFDRLRKSDREFYKSQMVGLKSFYMQQMEGQAERYKSEFRQLHENIRRIMQEHNEHQGARTT